MPRNIRSSNRAYLRPSIETGKHTTYIRPKAPNGDEQRRPSNIYTGDGVWIDDSSQDGRNASLNDADADITQHKTTLLTSTVQCIGAIVRVPSQNR